ncbi:MAG TPA: hypothetical protein VGO98_01985 [Candidatus Saccharimonadales bacterium]|jgi:hypothetical protein|nr:hypothetical protein [Candidatus Saccharimonadales bacterium]
MDPWQQRLQDTGISTYLDKIKTNVDKTDRKKLTTSERAYFDRLVDFTGEVGVVLENANLALISYTQLQKLAQELSNINSYFQNWIDGSGEAYLTSYTNQHLDNAVEALAALTGNVDVKGAKAAVSRIRQSAGQYKRAIDKLVEDIQTKGETADTSISEKLAEANQGFEKISEEVSELKEELEQTKKSLGKITAEQSTAFSTTESNRSQAFNALLADSQKALNEKTTELTSESKKRSDELIKQLEEVEKTAESNGSRIEKLLQISSQNTLISDYSKNANRERMTTIIWQTITVGSIIWAIAVASVLAHEATEDLVWQKLVARLALFAAAGALATYAAKQASESRDAQRNSEHMSLQLSAVRPYLEDISNKADRDKLLLKIADKLFGKRIAKDHKKPVKDKNEELISAADITSFIKEIIKRNPS